MWSALGKYKSIVISIALFLILDASVLTLNFYISFKIAKDAVEVNLAGRQRMLSQRTVKSLYEMHIQDVGSEKFVKAEKELIKTTDLFDATLKSFDMGGQAMGTAGETVVLRKVSSVDGRVSIEDAKVKWKPYFESIKQIFTVSDPLLKKEAIEQAIVFAEVNNLPLLKLMNTLTTDLEKVASSQATTLRYIQTAGITLAVINFLIILFHFLGELRTNDRKLELARQETTEILETVNEGLFLLDKEQQLGSQHSARLSDMFNGRPVENISFSDLIRDLVNPKDLETAERFVSLMFKKNINSNLIKDLNPLNEVQINIPDESGGYITRYLSFDFSRVGKDEKMDFVLVTVNDITRSVELASELAETKEKSEQQIEMLTSILHTNPKSLKRFLASSFDSFERINGSLKNQDKSTIALSKKCKEIFMEVHKFKGDAGALGLDSFSSLAHEFEEDIQSLQQKTRIDGNDFLKLAVHLEGLMRYTESIRDISNKLAEFSNIDVLTTKLQDNKHLAHVAPSSSDWAHLYALSDSVSQREEKLACLVLTGFSEVYLDEPTRSLINDMCIQFIRNSIVHSIENPESRKESGKPALARIDARLVTLPSGQLELNFRDDGNGIDFEKIRAKAIDLGKWDHLNIQSWNKKQLLSLIFESGFSTASGTTTDAGRGVGMDVIGSKVKERNGAIRVACRQGVDCQFVVTLPIISSEEKAA